MCDMARQSQQNPAMQLLPCGPLSVRVTGKESSSVVAHATCSTLCPRPSRRSHPRDKNSASHLRGKAQVDVLAAASAATLPLVCHMTH
jgi:hypothetical protein